MISEEFVNHSEESDARWSVHRSFIDYWHGGLGRESGCTRETLAAAESSLGRSIPTVLREWYALVGERQDLVGKQDHLLRPHQLKLEYGRLVFHVENQWCCKWFIREADLDRADPPVFVDLDPWPSGRPSDTVAPAASSTTEFCLHMLVQETVISGPGEKRFLLGHAPGIRERIHEEFVDLGLPYWHWPLYPRILLASPGAMDVLVDSAGPINEAELFVSARTDAALKRFLLSFPAPWEAGE